MSAATLSPDQIIREFKRVFKHVYDHEAKVFYVGNGLYQVNGEFVHHSILMSEMERLNYLLEVKRLSSPKRSAVQRLINKLRFM